MISLTCLFLFTCLEQLEIYCHIHFPAVLNIRIRSTHILPSSKYVISCVHSTLRMTSNGSHLWNSLPIWFQLIQSIGTFKKELKLIFTSKHNPLTYLA